MTTLADLVPTRPAFDGKEPLDPAVRALVDLLDRADVALGALLTTLSELGRPMAKMIVPRGGTAWAGSTTKICAFS
jgi:hypothetical protein